MNFLDMPNIYEFNTKRYEIEWLHYMRDSLDLGSYDVVVGHGSSAEALLRYLEQSDLSYKPVKSAVVLDATDIYTAGEIHGRAYHHSSIKQKSLTNHVIVGSTNKNRQEQSTELRTQLFKYHNMDNDHELYEYLLFLEGKLFDCVTTDEAEENLIKANKAFNNILNFCIKQSLKKTIST